MKTTLPERFWAKVNKDGPTMPGMESPCWVWTAAQHDWGYGLFGNPARGAHRISWELANGVIPAGLSVLHRCDNPPCIRPAHLFLGTQADNMKDRDQKGHYPQATLNQIDAIWVRILCAMGWRKKDVAALFGVAPCTVSNVVAHRNWKEPLYVDLDAA